MSQDRKIRSHHCRKRMSQDRNRSRSPRQRGRWGDAGPPGYGRREHRRYGRDSNSNSNSHHRQAPPAPAVPEEFSVHRGTVQRVEPYGCFVRFDGQRQWRDGLVHRSQYGQEHQNQPPNPGQQVWVKVLSVVLEGDDAAGGGGGGGGPYGGRARAKIRLSMEMGDQELGGISAPDPEAI